MKNKPRLIITPAVMSMKTRFRFFDLWTLSW